MTQMLFVSDWLDDGIVAGFSGCVGGVSRPPYGSLNVGLHVGDLPEAVQENRRLVAEWMGLGGDRFVFMEQVHGTTVERVSDADAGSGAWKLSDAMPASDGLVTTERNLALSVLAADCVPILFMDRVARVIGAAHAGWRGAAGGITRNTVSQMELLGARKERICVAIGPSIRGCCYEVDAPVVQSVKQMYDQWITGFAPPMEPSTRVEGRAMLDLPTLCKHDLRTIGLKENQVLDVSICTCCMPGMFSHRRDHGKTGRHGGFIYIR